MDGYCLDSHSQQPLMNIVHIGLIFGKNQHLQYGHSKLATLVLQNTLAVR